MRISISRGLTRSLFAGVVALTASVCIAQQTEYPIRPGTLVVPFTPGSTVDISARTFSRELGQRLRQPFTVENRPGLVAFRVVKGSAPDGYTLLWHANGSTIAQTVLKEPDFDIRRDFASVALILRGPLGLFVSADAPYRSVKDLIDDARKNPGKLNYGSSGVGSMIHLSSELFKSLGSVNLVHVPYKGGAEAASALMGGQIQFLVTDPASIPRDKSRLLALASKERSPNLPDVPTVSQSGGPDLEVGFWIGMFAPAATPRSAIDKLNSVSREALRSDAFQEYMKKYGYIPAWTSPEDMQRLVMAEVEQWTRIVRDAGIPLQ